MCSCKMVLSNKARTELEAMTSCSEGCIAVQFQGTDGYCCAQTRSGKVRIEAK